jgi:putative flippase GtrA
MTDLQPELARQDQPLVATRTLRQRLARLVLHPADRVTELSRAVAHRLHIPTTLVKFLIVGGIGFLINEVFLFVFYDSPIVWFFPGRDTSVDFGVVTDPDIRLLISSILAVEIAIICQFNLHERWTFRRRPRRGLGVFRFLKFNASSAVSPIIIVMTTNTLTPLLGLSPYISNAVGVLLGFTWNWTLTSLVIWPRHKPHPAGAELDDVDMVAGYLPATAEEDGQDFRAS